MELLDGRLEEKANACPSYFLGGQKQRIAIIRSLAMDPDVSFLTPILKALDPEMVGEVLELMKEACQRRDDHGGRVMHERWICQGSR